MIVIILSILAFSLIGGRIPSSWSRAGSLIPVIAAVGYEILRFGAKHRGNPIIRALYLPGIWLQMITTKQPTDDQIEVAIVSMEQALLADNEPVPEGSAQLPREPLDAVTAPSSVQVQPPATGA